MQTVVVRCPDCGCQARVDPAAVGLTVGCPGCGNPFVAAEEPGPAPPAPPRRGPLAPPSEPDDEFEAEAPGRPDPGAPADEADYDPHRDPPGGLPASVLVGLALLPFAIPILWLIAPAVLGRDPESTVAAPAALAVSAAVLCLAVIYTVDWSAGTRVKGVLVLIGLSYLAGAGLFFLKKDQVDRVRRALGSDHAWEVFEPGGGGYQVKLPAAPAPVGDRPLGLAPLACHRATHKALLETTTFTVGSARPAPRAGRNDPVPGADAWFEAAVRDVAERADGTVNDPPRLVTHRDVFRGREFEVRLPDGESVRRVRLFVVQTKGKEARVFYLAAEGADPLDDDLVDRFFDSLSVPDAR